MSWEDMVFWRVIGWKDDEDEAEDLEAGWSIVATGIIGSRTSPEGSGQGRESKSLRQGASDRSISEGVGFTVHSRQVLTYCR